MISVAFFNNKGGVGKTTLLCNLAAFLGTEKKRVLVVDADPQTNATQYMFPEKQIDEIYAARSSFTIHSVAHPLSLGKGFAKTLDVKKSPLFFVDVLLGDPRLALVEDVLAADWNTGTVRGLRTTFLFRHLLQMCGDYDFVFFDMGPSLGSINRSVLIGCDFFVIPMSIDIFSIRASENISTWLADWKRKLLRSIDDVNDVSELEVEDTSWKLKLLGYVSQQYSAKRDKFGLRRAVKAYDKVMQKIPVSIQHGLIAEHQNDPKDIEYELGTIPNLYSLVPMSQLRNTPIFRLKASDGIVGSHFAKVEESRAIFRGIAQRFAENLEALCD